MKVSDHFTDAEDFEDLLDLAESEAASDWEIDFIGDLRDKYKKWGVEMFLSDAQKETLERLAGKGI